MNQIKPLQEINLVDSFLYSIFTEKPQNAELIAKIIIEWGTGWKLKSVRVENEKPLLGLDNKRHGICMDLCIMEYEDSTLARVYDIKPNKYKVKELPKRSRYSQAMTDVKLLKAGARYKSLPEYMSIWILTEDPFGENRMVYTVKNVVEECPQVSYNDGVTKLFLYVDGKLGGTEELRTLLQYFKSSKLSNVTDNELYNLHEVVEEVKKSAEGGEHYMTGRNMWSMKRKS